MGEKGQYIRPLVDIGPHECLVALVSFCVRSTIGILVNDVPHRAAVDQDPDGQIACVSELILRVRYEARK